MEIRLLTPAIHKIAAANDEGSWLEKAKEHSTAIGAGAAMAAAAPFIFRKRLPTNLSPLQRMAQKGVGYEYYIGSKEAPSIIDRVAARALALGEKPIYVRAGARGGNRYVGEKAHLNVGDMGPGRQLALGGRSRASNLADTLERAGKPKEMSKEIGLTKLFPKGESAAAVVKRHGLKLPKAGASVEERAKFLSNLQAAIKKDYGKKYLLKPDNAASSKGKFPGAKGDWGKVYQRHQTELAKEISALRRDVKANPAKYRGNSADSVIANKYREHELYGGEALHRMLKAPKRSLVQRKENLATVAGVPSEFRVHLVGGNIPDELTVHRYNHLASVAENIPGVSRLLKGTRVGSQQEAAEWARKNVLPRLKGKYKDVNYGMDVMRVKKPGGGYDFKLVELNPSSNVGGSSGLIGPLQANRISKHLLGRDARAVQGAKLLGAGALGAGAGKLAPALSTDQAKG